MIQLIPIRIDDKKLYNSIAARKHIKNDHCSKCQEQDREKCKTCEYSNRFKMQRISEYVFERYDFYQKHEDSLDAVVLENQLSKDEEDLLRDAYENSSAFKSVRKTIMDNLPEGMKGKCPFCMISEPDTLDHYFPESTYPEYIVYSPNLVPCCSKCNKLKGNATFKEGHRIALHYYFDQIPTEQFFYIKVVVDNGIPVISFEPKTDTLGEIGIIIANHYERLELSTRYQEQCNDALSSLHAEMLAHYKRYNSVAECMEILNTRIDSLEKTYGKNYWMVCLYKALSLDEKTFQEFLSCSIKNKKYQNQP